MDSQLESVRQQLRKFRDEREWGQFHDPKNLAAAIAVEAAELQELFLWTSNGGAAEVAEMKQSEVESELADVLIQCLNFANVTGIDPLAAIERKIEENAQKYPVDRAKGSSRKYTEL